jgi:hypothetical protein
MLHKPLKEIAIADIRALQSNGVAESRTLEYKAPPLPSAKDEDKKEFLADVCALANTSGGDLIFGVEAVDGLPTGIPGFAGVNEDQEILRLESLIRDAIDPRISGVDIRSVPGGDHGPIIVIRVPQSWVRPHMVSFKNASKFFARNAKGKYQMDASEIRTAFLSATVAQEEFRRWRNERIELVAESARGKNIQFPLASTDFLILHVFPLNSAGNVARIQPTAMRENSSHFLPIVIRGGNPRFNLDGLMVYAHFKDAEGQFTSQLHGYTQLFRTGRVESAVAFLCDRRANMAISSAWVEANTIDVVKSMLEGLNKLEISAPYAISVSLVGAEGKSMLPVNSHDARIRQDKVILPEVYIDDLKADIGGSLRPMFDAMWNVAGFAASPNYDKDGRWVKPY